MNALQPQGHQNFNHLSPRDAMKCCKDPENTCKCTSCDTVITQMLKLANESHPRVLHKDFHGIERRFLRKMLASFVHLAE